MKADVLSVDNLFQQSIAIFVYRHYFEKHRLCETVPPGRLLHVWRAPLQRCRPRLLPHHLGPRPAVVNLREEATRGKGPEGRTQEDLLDCQRYWINVLFPVVHLNVEQK